MVLCRRFMATTALKWDCFIFHDEVDLLQCRLEELEPVIDRFVLVEARETFQGAPKPLHFAANAERFRPWLDRIVHVVLDRFDASGAREREAEQREGITRGLVGAALADWIFLSDVDEIPSAEAIGRFLALPEHAPLTVFEQRFHCFAVDWQHPEPWRGTLAARRIGVGSLQAMRDQRGSVPVFAGGGAHFSWIGGPAANMAKLMAFSHPELRVVAEPEVSAGAFLHEGRHVDGVPLTPVEVDATWPRYVRERRCPPSWFRPRKETPMMLSWNDVWPEVDATEGWLTEPEARRLFDLARSVPAPMLAVELGSYKGRSTIALGRGLDESDGGRLLCVDLWQMDGVDLLPAHQARISRAGLAHVVTRHRCDTALAARGADPGSVGLLFIDADHSYEAVRRDLEAWSPCVRSGGYVAFHDSWAPGPARVIAELPGWFAPCGVTDSLAVFRKG